MKTKKVRADYSYGSTARKLEYATKPKTVVKKEIAKPRIKRVYKSKSKEISKIKPSTVVMLACFFLMLMFVVYRSNVISEKNLAVINLRSELDKVESNVAATKMDISQNTNLEEIEAYAKQKLGMQKPDIDQVVYVDTSKNINVESSENLNFFEQLIQTIKEYINM